MRITVSEEEYEAIRFAEDQLEEDMEASDDDFAHDASEHCHHLRRLITRIRDAKKKDRELGALYQLAKKIYPEGEPNLWRKIARKSLSPQTSTRSVQT